MRVPLDWLREYCDPSLDPKGIEERLTMTGTKVEAIHHYGVSAVEHFVVGRVLEVHAHPHADRLKVCKVDLGAGAVSYTHLDVYKRQPRSTQSAARRQSLTRDYHS